MWRRKCCVIVSEKIGEASSKIKATQKCTVRRSPGARVSFSRLDVHVYEPQCWDELACFSSSIDRYEEVRGPQRNKMCRRRRPTPPPKKQLQVRIDVAEVHVFSQRLGDNPACRHGVALEIDQEVSVHTISIRNQLKNEGSTALLGGKRRVGDDLMIPSYLRERILTSNGYSPEAMQLAMAQQKQILMAKSSQHAYAINFAETLWNWSSRAGQPNKMVHGLRAS